MEYLSIFDFMEKDTDTVFCQLKSLNIHTKTIIQQLEIRRTDKYYEVESDEEHVAFVTLEQCYAYVQRALYNK